MRPDRGIDVVPSRLLIEEAPEIRIPLPPGDRAHVAGGDAVAAGDTILEHLRDVRVEEVAIAPDLDGGARSGDVREIRPVRGGPPFVGELLVAVPGAPGRWRLATGDRPDTVESPVAGSVTAVVPGAEIRVRPRGTALRGALAAGTAARGVLALATDPFGELRPGGIDVGRAGTILVVGARIDAEAIIRARAMGVRGIVVASLPGKELRDLLASERRQRAALHPSAPFGVLALDGPLRRPIASPVMALFAALAGREVALVVNPPALVFDDPIPTLPTLPPDWVRVRSGPQAGAEGRLVGLVGLRRFAAGVHLEAARVAIDGQPPIEVPVADLQRFR